MSTFNCLYKRDEMDLVSIRRTLTLRYSSVGKDFLLCPTSYVRVKSIITETPVARKESAASNFANIQSPDIVDQRRLCR